MIATAELAGVMAAKRTAELIPLCHPLPLTGIEVRIEIDDALPGFRIEAEVRTKAETGVEMEALTAVSVAALTLFDMLKAVDRTMVIGGMEVTSKTGGKSGDWLGKEQLRPGDEQHRAERPKQPRAGQPLDAQPGTDQCARTHRHKEEAAVRAAAGRSTPRSRPGPRSN